MRVMRANYDKPHRCPGWSGPAFTASRGDTICPGGSLAPQYGALSDAWKRAYKPHWVALHCPECDTLVLPFVLRWVDPSWIVWRLKRRWSNLTYELGRSRLRKAR